MESKELDPKKVCVKGDGTDEYGAKIKAYLENLGGEDYYKFEFRLKDMYFINSKGHIDLLKNTEGYHEISLKEKPIEPEKPKPIYMVDGVTHEDLIKAQEHAREVAMLNGHAIVYKHVSLFQKDIKIIKTEY